MDNWMFSKECSALVENGNSEFPQLIHFNEELRLHSPVDILFIAATKKKNASRVTSLAPK